MILLRARTTPFNIADQLAAYGNGANTEQLALEEIKVLCYPSGGAMVVNLPLSTYGTNIQNMKVLVAKVDALGGTVTVNGSTPSGGSAEIVQKDGGTSHATPAATYGSTKFEVATDGIWVARDSD